MSQVKDLCKEPVLRWISTTAQSWHGQRPMKCCLPLISLYPAVVHCWTPSRTCS
ncbi:hypothetical protein DPMN_169998 [Dreissena polymorpha]|uniref:Uncharacterized protein n=1 Tax=Dreissena polymorpha TaxID=45954 RepID=A0A9D4DW98_DREPO|nr:hypothetical protein DPMN_169998 [Dreissena polymorpha]